jgi:hypothetical protein
MFDFPGFGSTLSMVPWVGKFLFCVEVPELAAEVGVAVDLAGL